MFSPTEDSKMNLKKRAGENSGVPESNEQGSTERRFIRSGYVKIQNLINERRDDLSKPDSGKFMSIINEVDEMHNLVKKPREQVSDAEALCELATSLVDSVKSHNAGGVTPSIFLSCLVKAFAKERKIGCVESSQVLWKDIGVHVSPIFMNFRGPCTMLGPMGNTLKERKVAMYRKRTVTDAKLKPEELKNPDEEKTDTENIIITMFGILCKEKTVKLEKLVLNRTSFAQTVENLFALSFLVKDGRVVITVDENRSHHISPRNAPAAGSVMSREVVYSHFIFRLDFSDWKSMKDSVVEGEELMPVRTPSDPYDNSAKKRELNSFRTSPRTTAVRKLTRNRRVGVETQESPETGDGSNGISNKRKRKVCQL